MMIPARTSIFTFNQHRSVQIRFVQFLIFLFTIDTAQLPSPAYARSGDKGHKACMLQSARANGSEWDEDTCSNAAEGGHLELLQWAWANDADSDTSTC